MRPVRDDDLLEVLATAADAVATALVEVTDWRPMTERPTQYAIDVVADRAAVEVLVGHGLGVLSEESGLHHPDREVVVVLDPVDGSTNASRGIPWWCTSLAAVDGDGLRASLVVNQASGERFDAVRGGGARRDGAAITATDQTDLGQAIVAISGYPGRAEGRHLPWGQFRVFGAAALDLCAVACGRVDAFADTHEDGGLGPWDYLGGLLVCLEAGAVAGDVHGRALVSRTALERRSPVVAATAGLRDELVGALQA